MPSKAMLHDAAAGTSWRDAVDRRWEVVAQLDDTEHIHDLEKQGATLLRGWAQVEDANTVSVGTRMVSAKHLVLATGSEAIVPAIEGLGDLGPLRWTSTEALTTDARPQRLLVLGGGVIGTELAQMYSGFGTNVTLVDAASHGFPDLIPAIGQLVDAALTTGGVSVRRGVELRRMLRRADEVHAEFDDGSEGIFDRLLVATGKRARTAGFGLEQLGLAVHDPLPVGNDARVVCPGSVCAIGDVAGQGKYTHVANHHGAVLANQLVGDGSRRFDDAVTPSCVFTTPPVIVVGATMEQLADDNDVVWSAHSAADLPRATTDQRASGVLAVAARRGTANLIAAHGVGDRFDELAAALVVAIDGRVPLDAGTINDALPHGQRTAHGRVQGSRRARHRHRGSLLAGWRRDRGGWRLLQHLSDGHARTVGSRHWRRLWHRADGGGIDRFGSSHDP